MISHLYPKVKVPVGGAENFSSTSRPPTQVSKNFQELTIIAWLWARTVKCPNLACGSKVELKYIRDEGKAGRIDDCDCVRK